MLPFDLHVLGLPPAFTLSQDQTLHLSIAARPEGLAYALSADFETRLEITRWLDPKVRHLN